MSTDWPRNPDDAAKEAAIMAGGGLSKDDKERKDLRNWFAGMALMGYRAASWRQDNAARMAFADADAMLAESDKDAEATAPEGD